MSRAVPFIGRSKDLAAIAARFAEGVRLVTITGPGGIGKTAIAREHVATETDALLVDLTGAHDLPGILDAVAAVTSARGDDLVTRIGAALGARGEVLVVLEHFDGLVPFALATVGAWLELAPELRILVTSRERLGIVAEVVHEVGPLDAPVELLVAAARRAAHAFELRPEDAIHAAEIARLVEGVPLALELAGAQLPLLGARALHERLRGAHALAREARGGPERHASLDAAVRGSFDALAPHEKDALAELTVFRGGFTAESAAAVTDVAMLPVLVARSLVRTLDARSARFDLFAAVRAFVTREHRGPAVDATERHARYFVDRAEHAAAEAHHSNEARAWLAAEHANVIAVAERVVHADAMTALEAERALRAIVAIASIDTPFARIAALVSPVVERTRDSGADPRLAARATLLRGAMRRERGDVKAALRDSIAAESVGRALGDALLEADCVVELGRTVFAAGEVAAAAHHFDRAATLYASLAARRHEAGALAWLAVVKAAGEDLGTARALLERAVALSGEASWIVALLGRAAAEAGDLRAARRALESVKPEGDTTTMLGLVLHDGGDLRGATEAFVRARDMCIMHGNEAGAAIARGHLGVVAREEGRGAEGYALLADARDLTARAGLVEDSAYFAAHLAALDADVGRRDASIAAIDAAEASLDAAKTTWPLGARAVLALARGESASVASIHVRVAARVMKSAGRAASPPPPDDALLVGTGGTWFRPPRGARVGLERRKSLALLVDCLALLRDERPGAKLTAASLFAAAWPNEKALPDAAAHRVRVAIATLRKMGLRDLLVTDPDGYGLTPHTTLIRA